MMDHWNATIRRIHGVPPEWMWCKLDAYKKPEDFVLVSGAVPCGTITRGPRKGRPKWPKDLQTFWVRRSEYDETIRLYELETRRCGKCGGDKQEPFAWSRENGTSYRTCSRCKGTGKPNEPL